MRADVAWGKERVRGAVAVALRDWRVVLAAGLVAGSLAALLTWQSAGLELTNFSIWKALLPAATFFALGWAVCSLRSTPEDRLGVFLIAFGLRLVIAVILALVYQAQDEQILHNMSSVASDRGVHFWTEGTETQEGYAAVVALAFNLFGSNFLVAKLLNVVLGSIIPFLLYDIVGKVSGEERAARRVLLLGVFMPPLLFFSALNLKELPSAFLLTLTLWLLIIPKGSPMMRTAAAMAAVVATYSLRGGWAVFPLIAVLLFQIQGRHGLSLRRLTSPKVLAVLGVAVFVIMVPLQSLLQGAIVHIQYRLFIGAYAEFGTFQQAGSSITGSMLDLNNAWAPRNIAIQLVRAPFSPSPLEFLFYPGVQTFMDSLNALTQYALLPLAFIGVVRFRGRVMMIAGVEVALLITSGLSLMLGLTIQRHAVPHFAVVYLLASLGMPYWREHRWVMTVWCAGVLAYSALLVHYRV